VFLLDSNLNSIGASLQSGSVTITSPTTPVSEPNTLVLLLAGVDLFLGKATPAAVLSAATNTDPHKDQLQHCEAYFYLAEHALQQGRPTEAKRLFQQVIDTGLTYELQYAGAQTELKRLQASPSKTIK
jgi:lipoprotein NlpI